jgi:hypothetical protein
MMVGGIIRFLGPDCSYRRRAARDFPGFRAEVPYICWSYWAVTPKTLWEPLRGAYVATTSNCEHISALVTPPEHIS